MAQPFGFNPAVAEAMRAPKSEPPVVSSPPAPVPDEPVHVVERSVAEEQIPEPTDAPFSAPLPATFLATQAVPPPPEQPAVTAHQSVPVEEEVARQVAGHIESQVPATAEAVAASSGNDNPDVAALVHRVMERLKPGLIEEIIREMKEKK